MKINATTTTHMEVSVSMEEIISRLKEECGVRENPDNYYTVEDGKIIKNEDISYHGSPLYRKTVISDNPNVVAMYESILNFERAYKDKKEHNQ